MGIQSIKKSRAEQERDEALHTAEAAILDADSKLWAVTHMTASINTPGVDPWPGIRAALASAGDEAARDKHLGGFVRALIAEAAAWAVIANGDSRDAAVEALGFTPRASA